MPEKRAHIDKMAKSLAWACIGFYGFLALGLLFFLFQPDLDTFTDYGYFVPAKGPHPVYEHNYDVSQLGNSEADLLVAKGYELFMRTSENLGPLSGNDQMNYSGNVLSCNNCHLDGGTKAFAAPLIGIIQRFPQYRGRENKIGTIEERINGCMERSMNGQVLDPEGEEMNAFIAYLEWLGRYAPEDGKIEGLGFLSLEIPNRAVDLEHGRQVFVDVCVACHNANGQGRLLADGSGYLYPPLWGPNSYNNGAGMTRVITAATFIKGNMPFGTTYDLPQLTDEEAFDVAGYINQQSRPVKPNLELDFPELTKKPVSSPYPPYADPFSLKQHQLGPFQEIMQYYLTEYNLKKTR